MGTDDSIDEGTGDSSHAAAPNATDELIELAELRQKRDRLVAQLTLLEHRTARRRWLRAGAVALLVALGCTSFTFAAVGVWVRRNVTDTDVWVERAGPLVDDPAVQAALGRWLSDLRA
jgi:hypothetical protein